MTVKLVYIIPFNLWQHYRFLLERFLLTFEKNPPEWEYELHVACSYGEPTDDIRRSFYGFNVIFFPYHERGCDIGAAQYVADGSPAQDLIVGLTTSTHFHRAGWLRRIVETRQKHGPCLIGTAGTLEQQPHLRTNCYAMDAALWQAKPSKIVSRQDAQSFECGTNCVTDWVKGRGYPTLQVTWDGERDFGDWRNPSEAGIYRRGHQNAMLAWDRHTDLYRDADEAEKKRLANLADGG